MKEVLMGVSQRLLPFNLADSVVQRHIWRNSKYVGSVDGRVQAWCGWSINFHPHIPKYRTIYFDHVVNKLPNAARSQLFGEVFARAIASYSEFVFMFVTSCALRQSPVVTQKGLIYRQINDVIHPGFVSEANLWIQDEIDIWVTRAIQLLELQSTLTEIAH
jgi:hypothetical protein